MSEQRTTLARHRVVIVRTERKWRKRWRWSTEELWQSGNWHPSQDGYTLTLWGARRVATNGIKWYDRALREEWSVLTECVYEPYVPKKAPLSPTLLEDESRV